MKSLSKYLDKGGKVCDCGNVQLFGEIAKCKKHTRVHTIRHMGFWRWMAITARNPLYTIQRYLLLRKARKEAHEALERFKRGETTTIRSPRMVSMRKPD